ncbi:hypothetical protein [Mesorhizobium silamurunense]|uniref:hypothetical protein n=1 Tax=Mesorhizobium silamurunense TaxID=499528 RepID=UPI00178243C5|nr:hypothetical protein [Mesorhizobium silamurunense]
MDSVALRTIAATVALDREAATLPVQSTPMRWAKNVLAMFRHDRLFRCATIVAVLALIFLVVSMVQQVGGHSTGGLTFTPRQGAEGRGHPLTKFFQIKLAKRIWTLPPSMVSALVHLVDETNR